MERQRNIKQNIIIFAIVILIIAAIAIGFGRGLKIDFAKWITLEVSPAVITQECEPQVDLITNRPAIQFIF